jgi:thiol-disulfide isomerase/thioredoxin
MRRAVAPLRTGIALLCFLAASLQAGAQAPAPRTGPQVGDLAPAFSLQTLDGRTLTRDGLKGKVVVLDFWATWCAPCLRALPELKELTQRNASQPLAVVSVSVDDKRKVVEDFVRGHGMDWLQVWDEGMRATIGLFRVNDFPTYIVIGADGRIAYRQKGWTPARTAQQLNTAVEKALKDARKNPAESETAR